MNFFPSLRLATLGLASAALTFATDSDAPPLHLDRITVQADRLPIVAGQSSARVDILTRTSLASLPIKDAYDALNLMPNVAVQRYGSTDGEGSLSLYGQSAARTAPTKTVIAFNGVPLNSGMIAETSLNLVPFILVERTELVQGPAAVAYGSNAMTGVVNFTPRQTTGYASQWDGSYGTWDSSRVAAYAGLGKTGEYQLGLALQRRQTDGHLQPAGRKDFSDSTTENLAIYGSGNFERIEVNFAALHYGWERHSPSATLPGAALRTSADQGARRHYHLAVGQTLAPGVELSLTGWRNEARESSQPYLGAGNVSRQRTLNNGALLQLQWDTTTNLLVAGAEYQDATLTNRRNKTSRQGRTRGLFLQDRWLLLDTQLAVTAGARYDTTSTYSDDDFSPKLGFAYTPTGSKWTVRGNAARSYKSPSFSELYNTGVPLGNDTLTAQHFAVQELGIELRPLAGLTVGLNAYRAKLTDPIYPRSISTPPFTLRFTNVSDATTTDGVYATLDYRQPTWNLGASYAYLDPGSATFHTARHTAKLHGSAQLDRFTVAGSLTHAAQRFWQDAYTDPAPDYSTMDLKLSYRFNHHWQGFISAENLFDETYATGASQNRVTTPPPGFNKWVGLERPGRYLEAGLTLSL